MDKANVSKEFKDSLKAPFTFIPDPEGKLVKLYDVKLPVVSMAQRATFVVGKDLKVLDVQVGQDALDPTKALAACPLSAPH
jgi:peroxiredoxin Q/BCP